LCWRIVTNRHFNAQNTFFGEANNHPVAIKLFLSQ
jgi:hypothetical protein